MKTLSKIRFLGWLVLFLAGCGDDGGASPAQAPPGKTFTLQVQSSGGKVQSNLGGIDCGGGASRCSDEFNEGQDVQLTAADLPGSTIDRWVLRTRPVPPPEFTCREQGERVCSIKMIDALETSPGLIEVIAVWTTR